ATTSRSRRRGNCACWDNAAGCADFRRGWSAWASAPSMCGCRRRKRGHWRERDRRDSRRDPIINCRPLAKEQVMAHRHKPVLDRRTTLGMVATAFAFAALGTPVSVWAQAAPLKIATIGAGREGGALGTLFAKAGHPVMFSSRHPEQLK